jgi:hypothetical protein
VPAHEQGRPKSRKTAALATPTDLGENATRDLTGGLNLLLADVAALYWKTKNFHWHISGPQLPRLSPDARRAGDRRSTP